MPTLVPEPTLISLPPEPGQRLGKYLQVLRENDQLAVFNGALPIHIFDADDRAARAATVAMLSRLDLAQDIEIGEVFGVHRNTVARLTGRLESGGLAAVVPAKRGPKGPHKVTPQALQVVRENSALGPRPLARLVAERTGVKLTPTHVQRLARQLAPVQPELEMEVATEPTATVVEDGQEVEAEAAEVAEDAPLGALVGEDEPAAVVVEGRASHVGATLYFGAVERLGLLEAARACFRLPGVELFGVRAVVLTLFYLSVLGRGTVEAAKHLRRWEFGHLIGVVRAPSVKTLRRKLAELVQQSQASRFGELLSRRWVEQALVATAYLYVDGHMKLYTGKRKLAEAWNSQRRMPLPGLLSYWVNDQQGRPLLFVTEEANASLAKVMPKMVEAIERVLDGRPFVIIFDRGGYDGKLFTWLREREIDFITYQRGEPKRPLESFRRRQTKFEGRDVRMQIAEDTVQVAKSGPWRRIVVRTKDGHQTPILTSLGEATGSARVACLMFARWRQENFFRYMRERHGLDQLLGYAYAGADEARLVPNPELKQLEKELRSSRQGLAALRAELGQAVLDEPRDSARTAHGLKIAQGGAVARVRELENLVAKQVALRQALPKQVPLAEAGRREVMRLEHKAIIDRVKITAYNAEEWLLERLVPHYDNPHDVRDLLRAFASLGGEVRKRGGRVDVLIDPPDLPAHRRALRGLCATLNQDGVVYPGTDLPVNYEVAMHHSERAA